MMDWSKLRAIGFLLWRNRLWLVGAMVLGAAIAVAALKMATPIYRASTTILVEPQKIPKDYVATTVTLDLKDRLKTVEQQVTNRPSLTRLVREVGLYHGDEDRPVPPSIIQAANRGLEIETKGSIVTIHFNHEYPEIAANAVNHVANSFIQENLRIRQGQAESTTEFLDDTLVEMKRNLEEQEAKVAAFRLLHDGELPEQYNANNAEIQRLEKSYDSNRSEIEALETRRIMIQQGLAVEKRPGGSAIAAAPTSGPVTDLAALRKQLVAMLSTYTEQHPEVIRLKAQIASLERQVAATPPSAVVVEEIASVDPVLEAELRRTNIDLERLRGAQERILSEMSVYQRRLERIPKVEMELQKITRDYDNLETSYQDLLKKQLDAQLAESLEKGRQSEQFTIVEKAVPPENPHSPKAFMYLMTGISLGLAASSGFVLLREEVDQTYRTTDSLAKEYPGVPVLATIYRIEVAGEVEDDTLEESVA